MQIGFAWQNGRVVELEPGIEAVDDANFDFVCTAKRNKDVIQFGNIAYVTTREGFCRPVYINGNLKVLSAGYMKFTEPNITVQEAFPTSEIIKLLSRIEVMTRDRTPMLVHGQVTYLIRNPQELVLNLGYEKLNESLERCTDAILRHAFSITDLSTISPTDHMSAKNLRLNQGGDSEMEGASFRSDLCHKVHLELQRSTKNWGLEIRELAISDIQFKDEKVASKLALATSNTRTAEAQQIKFS